MKTRSSDVDLTTKHYSDAARSDERHCSHEPTACLPGRTLGFYICCNNVYTSHNMALDHWIDNHFLPFKGTMNTVTPHGLLPRFYYPPNPCKSHDDLLNVNISLVSRTEYYLSKMNFIPDTPSQFRPTPHKKPPHEFENPYTAVLAMAYDFVEAIVSKAEEYYLFLNLILSSDSPDFGCEIDEHIAYFPIWADYCYPSLPKVIDAMPKGNHGPHKLRSLLYHSYRDTDGYHLCPTPGCEKKYKQRNGLKYHLQKGHCTVTSMEDIPSINIYRCIDCPFFPCSSSFSTIHSLKYHLFRFHLKPEHFTAGKGDLLSHYTCPIYSCSRCFPSTDSLRSHLLESHVRLH